MRASERKIEIMCEQKQELVKDQAKGYGHEYTQSPETGGTLAKAWMILSEGIRSGKEGDTKCCFINLFSSPFDIKGMASSGLTRSLNKKMKGLHNLPDVYWVNIILHSSGNSSKTAVKDKEKEKMPTNV